MPIVLIEKLNSPQITILTLNRPERRNALTIELMNEFIAALQVASDEASERVLILRGAGDVFLRRARPESRHAEKRRPLPTWWRKCWSRSARRGLITIAAVHGAAVAGGAGTDVGLRLRRRGGTHQDRVSRSQARPRAGTGHDLSAAAAAGARPSRASLYGGADRRARAREIGLVNRVVPEALSWAKRRNLPTTFCKARPSALRRRRSSSRNFRRPRCKTTSSSRLNYHMKARESAEAPEGIAAFIEKRSPKWEMQ